MRLQTWGLYEMLSLEEKVSFHLKQVVAILGPLPEETDLALLNLLESNSSMIQINIIYLLKECLERGSLEPLTKGLNYEG